MGAVPMGQQSGEPSLGAAAGKAPRTPRGEKTHRITYGGPPRSLPRWSVNVALDWLRRRAMESE